MNQLAERALEQDRQLAAGDDRYTEGTKTIGTIRFGLSTESCSCRYSSDLVSKADGARDGSRVATGWLDRSQRKDLRATSDLWTARYARCPEREFRAEAPVRCRVATDDPWTDRVTGNGCKRTEREESYLLDVRDCLADYQEGRGTSRGEYSFASLVKAMGEATGRSLLALIYAITNVIPIVEVFVHVLRFVLDKAISIRRSGDFRQAYVKYAILAVQLTSVYLSLTFIFGTIVLPIVAVAIGIARKIIAFA